MSKYILMHGTFVEVSDNAITHRKLAYVDLEPDEAMHWKYVKREKLSNGKYRYYYDQSELDAAKAEMDKAAKTLSDSEKIDAKLEAGKNGLFGPMLESFTTSKEYKDMMSNFRDTAKRTAEKYQKLKVSSFVERTISKGFVKVANFFSDLFNK